MDLRELFKNNPKFHRLVDIHPELSDELTSWEAQMDALLAMQDVLEPRMNTLETGCGRSTVMFAASGTNHWCVTPAKGETERVAGFCQEQNISTNRVHFLIGDSQDILPKLDSSLRLHLVFIDGGHFFPIPCFDWYYAGDHLIPEGLLVVDDVRIPTVRILFDFLQADENWELIRLVGDTAFFRKLKHRRNLHDWLEQNYNRGYPDWSFLPPVPQPGKLRRAYWYARSGLGKNLAKIQRRLCKPERC